MRGVSAGVKAGSESILEEVIMKTHPVYFLFPGGHRKLAYYLNEGYYGAFRIFLREPVSRIPIVVKVRGPSVS